jgi:hypothetical protein
MVSPFALFRSAPRVRRFDGGADYLYRVMVRPAAGRLLLRACRVPLHPVALALSHGGESG